MVKTFNPLEYVALQQTKIVQEVNVSATDQLDNITKKVRAYLRDRHRESFARSVIDPKTREELKTGN
ncbi:MAG: hypothetical protein ACOX2N_07600 [Peptococcia bacterium]